MSGRTGAHGEVEDLEARVSAAEDELEDIRLFRPRPELIAEAQRRLATLRAQLTAARQAAAMSRQAGPARAPRPRSLAEELARVFVVSLRGRQHALLGLVRSYRGASLTVDELRLLEAAWHHLGRPARVEVIRAQIDEREPDRARPEGPPPPLVDLPPRAGVTVDARDGLALLERAVLVALWRGEVTHEAEPRPLRALRRDLEELGIDPEEGPSALAELVVTLGSLLHPLLEVFQVDGAEPRVRLTALAGSLFPRWLRRDVDPRQPVPLRVPLHLLEGRLGLCAIPLAFLPGAVLHQGFRWASDQAPELGTRELLLGPVSGAVGEPSGCLVVHPELTQEVGRSDRRGRLTVTRLPPLATWQRATEHLEELARRHVLDGVEAVRLELGPSGAHVLVELNHPVYVTMCAAQVREALRGLYHFQHQCLIDGRVVSMTPVSALRRHLEHRLAQERFALTPQLLAVRQRMEVVEGALVATQLRVELTQLLRAADAVPGRPDLPRWVLEHAATCASQPELAHMTAVPTAWGRTVRGMVQWLRTRLAGWEPAARMDAGFTPTQAEALVSGRAFLRSERELLEELTCLHLQWLEASQAADRTVLRQRVALDLNLLSAASWLPGAALPPHG